MKTNVFWFWTQSGANFKRSWSGSHQFKFNNFVKFFSILSKRTCFNFREEKCISKFEIWHLAGRR